MDSFEESDDCIQQILGENYCKINTAIAHNIDWLNESLESITTDSTDQERYEAYSKSIQFIAILFDSTMYKVFVPKYNQRRVKWGNFTKCRFFIDSAFYAKDREAAECFVADQVKRLKNKNIEIAPWRCKTFGLFGSP